MCAMSLIVIIGPQAVGKMTVGKRFEEKIDGKLLFNHQTIDLYANFLGYGEETFRLSDWTRKELFRSFVKNKEHNLVETIIFTVLIAFDEQADVDFLEEISQIFLTSGEKVYFLELVSDVETRLKRNVTESRLKEKPSKRNLEASKRELLTTMKEHRLNSYDQEVAKLFPNVRYLKIDNTHLLPKEVVDQAIKQWKM